MLILLLDCKRSMWRIINPQMGKDIFQDWKWKTNQEYTWRAGSNAQALLRLLGCLASGWLGVQAEPHTPVCPLSWRWTLGWSLACLQDFGFISLASAEVRFILSGLEFWIDLFTSSKLTPSNKNILHPKPLAWSIHRFCAVLSTQSARIIFISFFKSREIFHRSKSLLATELKTAYPCLILKGQTSCWYRCQILMEFSRGSALERVEESCFISLHRLLKAVVLSSHMENYWGDKPLEVSGSHG